MKKYLALCIAVAGFSNSYVNAQYKHVTVYTTAKDSKAHFAKQEPLTLTAFGQPLETQPCVFVDPSKTFQTFIGVGGAITDAAAETFYKLPEAAQKELIKAYYDPVDGIAYHMARTNINSCDFSSDTYTYIADGDSALKTFDVQHDKQFKIPMIKLAMAAANGLNLFVSPWSPPAWMKTNNNMLQGGNLLPGYMHSWAAYYAKFIKTYESLGMPVWGVSVQNEPMAKQKWESCIYSAEQERDFVKGFLGPVLQSSGLSEKKLIVWDHNRDLVYQRADVILNDKDAAKYVWGVGFHWYETWTGGGMQFHNLGMVHEAFPDKSLIFTEGCVEKFDRSRINDWALGERYGYSMVNDFNNGTVAWTDWNVLLDENGGPNHVGNFCFAPIHADTKTGKLMYTNSYYYIGHFSKYIQPGAERIACTSSRDGLETTAFKNKDGKLVVVVLNRSETDMDYKIWLAGDAATAKSPKHSISTLIID